MSIDGVNNYNKLNNAYIKNLAGQANVSKNNNSDFEAKLKSAMDKKDEKELRKACDQFEELFLGMLFKQMKDTVPKSGLFPDEPGKDIIDSMMNDVIVSNAAKKRSFGISDMLYKQLSKDINVKNKDEE